MSTLISASVSGIDCISVKGHTLLQATRDSGELGLCNSKLNRLRALDTNSAQKTSFDQNARKFVSGEIPAKKLAVMTSEEMASEEQKAALKKIKEDNLFQSLSAQETEAETE